MRVISGKFRGKKLLIPSDAFTRPLRDSVKESIFNILQHSKLLDHNLLNSNILDLFCGVGTFGLECISRQSKHVTFFENHPPALKILKKNIQNLECSIKAEIIEEDIFDLKKLNLGLKNYEFIFLDPPFKELRIKTLLKLIKDKNILKKNGVILIHRDRKTLDQFPKDFKVVIKKNYGRSRIFIGKFC
tara:strand:+ start:107 stop:670 length:564 start_codon:yes stop_codon:yes gene_type:complete